jgi:selenocysteine-specific elongation factor
MSVPGLVLGTAGHIDHGKTSLVRALTGVDLDTLPEEKERGITIALHFTHLALPDGRSAAFVDVPGHERLVRTMIAGATGIDAVVFCVSAVEGAMPQTREHLAILDLLGVRHGVIVLTMADLVDAELLELAGEEIRDLVKSTFLADAPIVPFSSVTGTGKDELLRALSALPDLRRPTSGPFRLPIDRVFVRTGFGTVVTGTTLSGALDDGAQVVLLPDGLEARVRGIELHGAPVDRAEAGRRTALNLSGVAPEQVSRGMVVTRGPVPVTSVLDVWYRALANAPALEEGTSVRVLSGTLERGGRLYLAQPGDQVPPGFEGWVQLRLDAPVPCLPGDRVVVRRPSPADTLGGGRIVDPYALKVRTRDAAERAERLARLDAGDRSVWLTNAGESGLSAADVAAREIAGGVRLADRWFAPAAVEQLRAALERALGDWHAAHPLLRGAPRRDLRRARLGHLPEKVFDALLEQCVADGTAALEGPLARLRSFQVTLDDGSAAAQAAVIAALQAAGLEGRTDRELGGVGPEAGALVRLLEADGRVRDVPQLGWVWSAALDALDEQVRAFFTDHEALTPSDFKDLTGLTRKAAIPLLEWLDRRKLTKRDGDRRVRGASFTNAQ